MQIAVAGTGYVGLVTGACLSESGHDVICVDNNSAIIEKIASGNSPIYEPGLDELLKKNLKSSNLSVSTSLHEAVSKAEVIFIAVGTPFDGKRIDLCYIEQVAKEIGEAIKESDGFPVVVVKSTVVPTTAENVVLPILEEASGKKAGEGFGLCSNPEFLREGSAVDDFLRPDRIVIGSYDDKSHDVLRKVYGWTDVPKVETNLRTAEMIKYSSNSLLALLISYSNELANLAFEVGGIDIKDVLGGLHLDYRLNPRVNGELVDPKILTYLEAGCGFGGSCFPKDVRALISFGEQNGLKLGILEQVMKINSSQQAEVMRLLKAKYTTLDGLEVSVLGLAFKPDTDDLRESPAIIIVDELLKEGANVTVYDPVVKGEFSKTLTAGDVSYASSWEECLKDKDATIVVTRWDEFKEINKTVLKELMKNPVLVDARRMFDKNQFKGVDYLGIGYRPV